MTIKNPKSNSQSARPNGNRSQDEKTEWWESGVRFECQGSGQCCVSRGEYGFVYMNLDDRRRMAKTLKMSTSAFTKKYCKKTDGVWHLVDGPTADCLFLKDGNRCAVYKGRPEQCRTWPFWPEVMNAKTWKKEVASYCPGVGKGRLYSAQEIRELLQKQESAETKLVHGR
jgi:Fe-S-cluster containining protein